MRGVMRQWYYRIPGNFYANGPLLADSMGAAKEYVRRALGVTRLPNGTEVWPA